MINCGLTRSIEALPRWKCRYNRLYQNVIARRLTGKVDVEQPRLNPVGIQYLSDSLQKQIFGKQILKSKEKLNKNDELLIKMAQMSLNTHGLLNKKTSVTKPIAFDLPKLQGNSLDEHFQKIGHFVSQPYKDQCDEKFTTILPKPKNWLMKPGWYRYSSKNSFVPEKVAYPQESLLVFDVETLYNISPYPIIACALSDKAWYLWCSPYICDTEEQIFKHLIDLNGNEAPEKKTIIGHNVSYDRARVLNEYNFAKSNMFYLDTQSLHIATSGLCSRQRPAYLQRKKKRSQKLEDQTDDTYKSFDDEDLDNPWIDISSMNSLSEVAQLYCNIKMNKDPRDLFSAKDKNVVIENFQYLVNYCATDVEVTSKVFDKVYPIFKKKCPHPISFGALKNLGNCILPLNYDNWNNYIGTSEKIYQNSKNDIEGKIQSIIDEIIEKKDDLIGSDNLKNDPWLRQLDWTVKPVRYSKKTGKISNIKKLPGYPEWYRALFSSKDMTKPKITIKTRLIPILFKLSWEGYPIVWTSNSGWCFPIDTHLIDEFENKNYYMASEKSITEYKTKLKEMGVDAKSYENTTLFKVPHPTNSDSNATSLLSKGYTRFFEKGVMTAKSELAHQALQINASASYWISSRERIMSQFVVSQNDFPEQFKHSEHLKLKNSTEKNLGIIIPGIVSMGTVTRRAVEKTWLTASNAKKNRIGSELKTQIRAPKGYSFVGADVDSEELWIASLVGDSVFKMHGGTPIGWMCLEGTKNESTDLHSKSAEILGCSRNEAKIFNYGRIYGAGKKFAAQLLQNFNPTLTEKEATQLATNLYEKTKGNKSVTDAFERVWYGGSESVLFNKLEKIANEDEPKTPVLGCEITSTLQKQNLGKNSFLPSRINWAIQSSGVDYLHLLCCSMAYLIDKYRIDARLCISIHDEIRYMVSNEDKYRAAMALQISNLWTRAMFCEQMGIKELPQNCAFFSAVDIDFVLRKEVDMDCITPSNPVPIPHGESLDIRKLLAIPESLLIDPDPGPDKDISKYPFEKRERVFYEYDKAFSQTFMNYYLRTQIVDKGWKIKEIERDYIKFKNSLNCKNSNNENLKIDFESFVKLYDSKQVRYRDFKSRTNTEFISTTKTERHERQRPSFSSQQNISTAADTAIIASINANEADTQQHAPLNYRRTGRKRKRVFGGDEAFESFYKSIEQKANVIKSSKSNTVSDSSLKNVVSQVLSDNNEFEVKPRLKLKPSLGVPKMKSTPANKSSKGHESVQRYRSIQPKIWQH